jgi:hypothetical protein
MQASVSNFVLMMTGVSTLGACAFGHDSQPSRDGLGTAGAALPSQGQALTEPPSIQVDGPCNPATEGWKRDPIVVSPEAQAKIDRGEPVWISNPPDYQHLAPIGVPYCEFTHQFYPGESRGREVYFWAARCASDADCPTGSRCPVDGFAEQCSVECVTDGDCSLGKACAVVGSKGLRLCQCGPPTYCYNPPDRPDPGL